MQGARDGAAQTTELGEGWGGEEGEEGEGEEEHGGLGGERERISFVSGASARSSSPRRLPEESCVWSQELVL